MSNTHYGMAALIGATGLSVLLMAAPIAAADTCDPAVTKFTEEAEHKCWKSDTGWEICSKTPEPVVNAEGPVFILNHLQSMSDDLARAHWDESLKRATHYRLVRALQLRNRAERATERAARALAAATAVQ